MKGQLKFHKVMSEFKHGSLHSGGSGKKVTDPKQAQAIAFSEARKKNPRYGKNPGHGSGMKGALMRRIRMRAGQGQY